MPEFTLVGKKVDKLVAVIREIGTAEAISDFFLSADGIDLATDMNI
jgi:hypothetical protein